MAPTWINRLSVCRGQPWDTGHALCVINSGWHWHGQDTHHVWLAGTRMPRDFLFFVFTELCESSGCFDHIYACFLWRGSLCKHQSRLAPSVSTVILAERRVTDECSLTTKPINWFFWMAIPTSNSTDCVYRHSFGLPSQSEVQGEAEDVTDLLGIIQKTDLTICFAWAEEMTVANILQWDPKNFTNVTGLWPKEAFSSEQSHAKPGQTSRVWD